MPPKQYISIEEAQHAADNSGVGRHDPWDKRYLRDMIRFLRDGGYLGPITIQREGHVLLDGNTRLEAAKALGWKEIEVEYQNPVSSVKIIVVSALMLFVLACFGRRQ